MGERNSLVRTFMVTVATVTVAMGMLLFTLPTKNTGRGDTTASATAILGARVFDGRRLIEGATVVIRDGRVAAIGNELMLPANVRRIDAGGSTVLPGLIDAHTHTYGDALRDSLRFGVTTNLDMFTAAETIGAAKPKRDEMNQTTQADLFSAGVLATVAGGHGTGYGVDVETLAGADDVPTWVARRIAEGSDYIKLVYMPYQQRIPSLDLATARAVIDAAHDAGLMAVAHIYSARGAQDMLSGGIDGLVHVFADELVSDDFIRQGAEAKLFIIPTLSVLAAADMRGEGAALANDTRVAPYLTANQESALRSDFGMRAPGMNLDLAIENTRRLHSGGVTLLAGSDAPNPGTTHGASLHHELALLVRAGLTPQEALAAATALPASRFAIGTRGTLAVGARADLIIVAGDPFTDITDTRRITHVFKNGYEVSRNAGSDENNPAMPAGPLSVFDRAIDAPPGYTWAATDDSNFGGQSTATIEHLAPDTETPDGAMRVRASIRKGFAFPWGGAYFGPRDDALPRDASDIKALTLRLRGTPGTYRVLFFNANSMGPPPTWQVSADNNWRELRVDLDSVTNLNRSNLSGLAIVGGPAPGEVTFDVADVRFED